MRGLLLSLIAVVLIAVAGLGWLISQVYSQLDPGQADTPYIGMGRQLAKTLDTLDGPELVKRWPSDGPLELSLSEEGEFPLPAQLRSQLLSGEAVLLEDNHHLLINYFLPQRQAVLTLAVANPTRPNEQASVSLTLAFYAGLILVLVLCLYPLVRRLMLLQESARAFGAGDLNARIEPSRWSYIRSLEEAFNHMAEQVQNLLADNRLLSRAVSHDLKTPMARLRFGFEMLEESRHAEQSARYLQRIGQDLNAMEALINRLLDYAKLEEGHIKLELQPLNLNTLVAQLWQQLDDGQHRLQLELAPEALWIQADSHYLAMLINNLLSNAKRYGREQICLHTARHKHRVVLRISDDGPGIPKEERQAVFKPFVRGQTSAPQGHGHGMGLAIVERIASWHKAEISLHSDTTLGGLCVHLSFAACARPN